MSRLLQTHVWHESKLFFVSTINRESSAVGAYGDEHAETLVWECDPKTAKRADDIIHQADSPKDSCFSHINIVQNLLKHGVCKI